MMELCIKANCNHDNLPHRGEADITAFAFHSAPLISKIHLADKNYDYFSLKVHEVFGFNYIASLYESLRNYIWQRKIFQWSSKRVISHWSFLVISWFPHGILFTNMWPHYHTNCNVINTVHSREKNMISSAHLVSLFFTHSTPNIFYTKYFHQFSIILYKQSISW